MANILFATISTAMHSGLFSQRSKRNLKINIAAHVIYLGVDGYAGFT